MLVIRLARGGRAKYPTYRIVAAESARAATGKFVAVLGHYNPHTKELVMKHEDVAHHLSNGAQPSNTVIKLLMREKVELPEWVKLQTKAPRPVEEPAEEPKAKTDEPKSTPADQEPNDTSADNLEVAPATEEAAPKAQEDASN